MRLGILMLDGKMADVAGCMASSATFPYPVVRRIVTGARPPASAADVEALLPLYLEAARELEREGVSVLTENCNGLMVLLQDRLAASVSVPVVTSALLMVPQIHRMMPARRIGILAFHPESVGEEVYNACGWSAREIPVAVGGVAGSEAWQEFLRTKEIPDRRRLEADLVAAGRRILDEHPDLGAFVCECTLMPPANQALRDALRLPVYDVLNLLDLAMRGLFRPPDSRAAASC
ncbi:MAG TPA: aspartate/glutamate racemase family protein [Thermoanaerobaculia bacterium]|nr:aspartate/glutamate racemase family protein [Thermoanaerobaculia bacterium]